MNYFESRANELVPVMTQDRRHIHENAEAGMDLPKTTAYVMNRLEQMGLEPKEICHSGVTAVIEGKKPGKTILLRADMDALPMGEENDLSFRTKTNAAHTCGHDMHTTMLLCAAQMLMEKRDELCGNVKLMFQPGEEVFEGSEKMIESGILQNPDVDAAMAIHVMLDDNPGTICYGEGFMTSSCDGFEITIKGKGCHGAMPHMGIDPINACVHIYQAFQGLIAREVPPTEVAILTFGQFSAGNTSNIMPEEAVLKGTLRTYNPEIREKIVARMKEVVHSAEEAFQVKADYKVLSAVPPTYTNPELLGELLEYVDQMNPDLGKITNYRVTPSDDFAFVSEKVPSVYFMLCAKVEGNEYVHHNPKVQFHEDAMPIGASMFAQCAMNWLNNHQ